MERVLQSLAEGERARGVDTRALVVGTGRQTVQESVNGVPVTRAASMLRVGSVWFAPALMPLLARVETDILVLHEPNPMALLAYCLTRPRHRLIDLVPQRGAPAALALPPDLRAVPERSAPSRASASSCRRRRCSSTPRPLRPHARRCEVIPFGLDVAGPRRRQPPVGERRAEPVERAHRALRRPARSLQRRGRAAARAGARRQWQRSSSATDRCAASSSV